jgi:methylmalonyl-CoA carboxyltransferase large subunit
MKAETVDLSQVLEALEGLKRDLAQLGERISTLEAVAGKSAPTPPTAKQRDGAAAAKPQAIPQTPTTPRAEPLGEELVLVISAAIAAFLGKKAHIRAIRLIGTGAWAQQGRVTIQASHALSVHSGRS